MAWSAQLMRWVYGWHNNNNITTTNKNTNKNKNKTILNNIKNKLIGEAYAVSSQVTQQQKQ